MENDKKSALKTNNNQKKARHDLDLREEELELIMKANDIKEEIFDLGINGDIIVKNEIADFILEQIDDPDKKYELYYNVIQRLLKKHLPKGNLYSQGREMVYEEKNVFLTGKRKDDNGIRHKDSRMAISAKMSELIEIISNWIVNNGTMYDLYVVLHDKNKECYGI